MNPTIIITTKLKTNDAVAATALQCLRDDLGYASKMHSIGRQELWWIETEPADVSVCKNLARRLVEETRVFVNPNKHTCRIYLDGFDEFRKSRIADGLFRLNVFVQDIENTAGTSAMKTLRRLYDFASPVLRIRFGILWTLDLSCETPETAAALAEEMAISRSQSMGLLANPHSQSAEVL
jgi:hypothetical protein